MFASSGGVRWLEPVQRRRRRRVPVGPILAVVALLAIAAGAFAFIRSRDAADDPSRATAQRFADAWAKGDLDAAYELTTARTQKELSARLFRQSYRQSARAATARKIVVGEAGDPQDGVVPVPVTVRTRTFGALKGTIRFPVERKDDVARVAWTPDLRLPGLRPDERVDRRILRQPPRANVLDGDGRRLSRTASAAGLSASLDDAFDARLSGRPGAELWFGKRVVAKVKIKRGRSVRTTIRPSLQSAAVSALGDRQGAIAVVQPRTGNVLGVAGLALNGPQPPGSSFKIITLAAALNEGETKPSETFPVQTQATLSGVALRNAGDESCGGSLTDLVRALVQLGLRPARRAPGRQAARSATPRRSGSTRSRRSRARSAARSRTTSRTTSRSARARSARTATSPRRSRWRASAPRSPTTGSATGRGSCAATSASTSASSSPRWPTRSRA